MKAWSRKHTRAVRWCTRRTLLAGALLAIVYPRMTHAEGGELFLRLGITNEVAQLHHPAAAYPSGGGSWVYVPRFGATATYGITDWLSLGLGANVSLPRDVAASGVIIQGLPPGNLAARYLGLMVPVSVAVHLTHGGDWSADVVASGGPVFSQWQANDLRGPTGAHLPLEQSQDWYAEWFGRLSILGEWRPADWGAVSIGPYAGMSTARDIYIGVLAEGALIWGAGPSFE